MRPHDRRRREGREVGVPAYRAGVFGESPHGSLRERTFCLQDV